MKLRLIFFLLFSLNYLLLALPKAKIGKVCEIRFAKEEQEWEKIQNLAREIQDSLGSRVSESRGSLYINLKKGTTLKDENIRKFFEEKNFHPLWVRCMRI